MRKSKLVTNHVGTIYYWTDAEGRNVLYPATVTPEGKTRSALFQPVPVFGDVPKAPAWEMVSLPKHGLIRGLSPLYPVISDHATDDEYRSFMLDFEAREGYPWSFNLQTRINFAANGRALDHWSTIRRHKSCQTGANMPLSFGLHPYFPTNGQRWELCEQGQVLISSSQLEKDRALNIDLQSNLLILQVNQGIYWLRLKGYDQITIWSDRPELYLCVEPTKGKRELVTLRPDENRAAWCRIEFVPRY